MQRASSLTQYLVGLGIRMLAFILNHPDIVVHKQINKYRDLLNNKSLFFQDRWKLHNLHISSGSTQLPRLQEQLFLQLNEFSGL